MPMPPYPVYCYGKSCQALARYKIAARWSDGQTSELKTYGLACEACREMFLQHARDRYRLCRLLPGESVEEPAVFELLAAPRSPSA